MATFEYEVADRAGALSRGRADEDNSVDLILRFREQGRRVIDGLKLRVPLFGPVSYTHLRAHET